MSTGDIGVLGGYGAVGQVAARMLARTAPGRTLRIGGRRRDRAEQFVASDLGVAGVAVAVDVDDEAALAGFCAGCRVVVNCAGPSYRVLDRVARAAFAAGSDYVDAGGDEPVRTALSDQDGTGRVAVLSSGMMPGLTGLLPRWLAGQAFDEVHALTAHVGTMDRLTPAGAGDYLLSLGGGHGESQAAWRNGARALRSLHPRNDVELPFFPGLVNAYPYLSFEAERTARALALSTMDWFNVFDGGAHMMRALSRLQGAMTGQSDLGPAADELTRAAALDLFGRDPYQLMVFELSGTRHGAPVTRTLVLGGRDTYALTGTVVAMAATAVLAGEVPTGTHYAAEVLAPEVVVKELGDLDAVTVFELYDQAASAAGVAEEGEL